MAGRSETGWAPGALDGARFLVVEARYHAAISELLRAGAAAELARAAVEVEYCAVPGALEIATAIAMAERAQRFDGFVALGCVIRGETTHYDLVANESARGLIDLAVRERLAIGNGILTVENMEQALERADPARQDKGGFAALAALSLASLRRRFGESR